MSDLVSFFFPHSFRLTLSSSGRMESRRDLRRNKKKSINSLKITKGTTPQIPKEMSMNGVPFSRSKWSSMREKK